MRLSHLFSSAVILFPVLSRDLISFVLTALSISG